MSACSFETKSSKTLPIRSEKHLRGFVFTQKVFFGTANVPFEGQRRLGLPMKPTRRPASRPDPLEKIADDETETWDRLSDEAWSEIDRLESE